MEAIFFGVSAGIALTFLIAFFSDIKTNAKSWVFWAISLYAIFYSGILIYAYINSGFREFLTTTANFIASLGVIMAAGIAYWGSSATARLQKENEINKKNKDEKHNYPAKVIFELMLISSYNKANIIIIKNKISKPYSCLVSGVNTKAFLNNLISLQNTLSFEEILNYELFEKFQSIKIEISSLIDTFGMIIDAQDNIKLKMEKLLAKKDFSNENEYFKKLLNNLNKESETILNMAILEMEKLELFIVKLYSDFKDYDTFNFYQEKMQSSINSYSEIIKNRSYYAK